MTLFQVLISCHFQITRSDKLRHSIGFCCGLWKHTYPNRILNLPSVDGSVLLHPLLGLLYLKGITRAAMVRAQITQMPGTQNQKGDQQK